MKMRDQDLSRRQFLWGSSAAIAAAPLMFQRRPGTVARSAPRVAAPITGATVSPAAYGMTAWVQAAKIFDSYVGLPLATTIQKIYMTEGQYFTNPLPVRIRALARVGCQFIICVYPSRTIDERAKLANFLQLLNSDGIVYQVALVNEWNGKDKFATAQAYLDYWHHYAPVVKAAGVPLCNLVVVSSYKVAEGKIQPGFPTNPLPDRYWLDYYATAYMYHLRLDKPGGLLDQAENLGVPAGIAEFGIGAHGEAPMSVWDQFCPYMVSLAPRLPLGCLYWGSVNRSTQNVVTGPNDPKVPGIQQVIGAFRTG